MDSNYPIVRLVREQRTGARIKGRKPFFPKKIPYQRQIRRLGTAFDEATASIKGVESGIDVSTDPRAVVPERALVFELIGPVAKFEFAAQALGLEWLISEDLKNSASEEDDAELDDEEDEGPIPAATWLYLTMPSLAGLKRLLAQWNRYKAGKDAGPGQSELWQLFGYLRDLRVWSAKDRVDPSVAAYVRAVLSNDPDRNVLIEVDLWYRSESQRRASALETLNGMLESVGGVMLDSVHIPEIRFQGALIQVPARVARRLTDAEGELAMLDEIMTIRPQSSFSTESSVGQAPAMPELTPVVESKKTCIAALLDGYPVAAHDALSGRVSVHEMEVLDSQAPVRARFHGTAMASLVLHGDLHGAPDSLDHKIAVVPVLTGTPSGHESTPQGKLPIGVIYNSLKGIVRSSHRDLKNITIINHAICDANSPFVRRPSPWAALLDYFSHHHRLLFVVSAGNITGSFLVNEYRDLKEFEAAPALEQQAAFMNAIERSKAARGLLSPAESINSLTIGALHIDGAPPPKLVADPYPHAEMTNLASAVGFGVNRGLKPDLVEAGGRYAAGGVNAAGGGIEVHARPSPELGHLVAAPSPQAGDTRRVIRLSGTSNAAALVTRSCLRIADAVDQVYKSESQDWLKRPTRVPILKALAAHSCRWGAIGSVLEDAYPPQGSSAWSKRRDTIAKFLGYGRPVSDLVTSGADNRITLLADDVIKPEERHRFIIPLPTSMFGSRELRSITLTLAWTTPVVFTSADYRGVGLKLVDDSGKRDFWDGVSRSEVLQPNGATAERGTLVHLVLEGSKLKKAIEHKQISLGVQAISHHGSQDLAEIPYALAVSLQVGQSQRIGLYQEISAKVRERVSPRVTARV